ASGEGRGEEEDDDDFLADVVLGLPGFAGVIRRLELGGGVADLEVDFVLQRQQPQQRKGERGFHEGSSVWSVSRLYADGPGGAMEFERRRFTSARPPNA